MSEELKPCPFCGSSVILCHSYNDGGTWLASQIKPEHNHPHDYEFGVCDAYVDVQQKMAELESQQDSAPEKEKS